MAKVFSYLLMLCICSFISACESVGCTDPESLNYDPYANEEDGSCLYIADEYVGNYQFIDTTQYEDNTPNTYRKGFLNIEKMGSNEITITSLLPPCSSKFPFIEVVVTKNILMAKKYNLEGCASNLYSAFSGVRDSSLHTIYYSFYSNTGAGCTTTGVAVKL